MTLEDVDQTTGAIARRVVRIGCRRRVRLYDSDPPPPPKPQSVSRTRSEIKVAQSSHVTGFRDASGAESLLGSSCHHLSLHRRS
jgi:hypothetical protein